MTAISALALVALTTFCAAQGTQADYDRAAALPQRVAGKVFRAAVAPHWIGSAGKFWYRNELPVGRSEFLLADPNTATKTPAFDAVKLAAALGAKLGRTLDAERLPVSFLEFSEGKPEMRFQSGAKSYRCNLTDYILRESDYPSETLTPLDPRDIPDRTRRTGEATTLTFVNQTDAEVRLLWLDTQGKAREYGSLKPQETRLLTTYTGHCWRVAKADGTALATFVATETPALAVIDGKPAPRRIAGRMRPHDAFDSPIGRYRLFFQKNNVWLRDLNDGSAKQITQDGKPDDSYGGEPAWSPDGEKFVVIKTVPAQEHKVTLIESSPSDQEQPKVHTLDYLKPGDRIAHARPHLFERKTGREIAVSDALFPNPWEISDLEWTPDSAAFTFVYNQRGHQILRLIAVDAATGTARAAIDERSKTFIDYSGKFFLQRLPATGEAIWMSERDGWNHLYLYDTATGRIKNQITKGEWVVRSVDRVDEAKREIWFRAGGIVPGEDPYYVHYCRVNFDGSHLVRLTEGNGTHSVAYSPDGAYFVDSCSRVDLPPVTTLRRSADGAEIMDLEHGNADALLATGWRLPERFTAKGRDGVTDIYGVLWRPSNFDPNKKYPVIENIYAGPQASFVPKGFAALYGQQALAELGFIVAQIDGMGTSNRSKAFHDVCWKNLSDGGFPDRILWLKAAAARHPEMDLNRVGIYGTSAGGQNALAGLLLHGDFYKAGVADCGCHDNRMDKIWWNEQWMGWPVGPEYAANSNVTLAPRLTGKLLLMVGEMDSNVDPASTMQVVNALIKADKDFELLVSPGTGHGVAGTAYGKRRLRDFFVRALLGVEPRR